MTGTARPARGRDEAGLTTLEWLLIVAAVAGLAALAVVLVQGRVDETGQRISNPDPRVVAAMVAAEEIMGDAARDADEQPAAAQTYGPWSDYYTSKCEQLGLLYADAEIKMEPLFMLSPQVGPGVEITDEVEADNIETDRANAYATLEVPDPGKAVAHCRVTRRYGDDRRSGSAAPAAVLVVVRGCVNRPLRGAPGRGRRRRLLRRLLPGCAVGGQRPAVPLPVEPPQHQPAAAKTCGPWSDHYTSKCEQLGLLYTDAEIKMEPLEGDPVVSPRVVSPACWTAVVGVRRLWVVVGGVARIRRVRCSRGPSGAAGDCRTLRSSRRSRWRARRSSYTAM